MLPVTNWMNRILHFLIFGRARIAWVTASLVFDKIRVICRKMKFVGGGRKINVSFSSHLYPLQLYVMKCSS